MGLGESSTEYELCLQGRADQWSHLFWTTIREMQNTLRSVPLVGAPLPLRSVSVPISEFRIETQEELERICSVIRLELRRFTTDHRLTQGIMVTYTPLIMTGDKIQAKMYVGRKEVEDLKQRMAKWQRMDQMLPVNLSNHQVVLQDCLPTQLELEKVEEQETKVLCLGALCMDKAVMRKKNATEGDGDHVLTFPVRLDVL